MSPWIAPEGGRLAKSIGRFLQAFSGNAKTWAKTATDRAKAR
jgi:hypothetical protein